MSCEAPEAFVRRQTAPAAPGLVPEVSLYLASALTPLWHATEKALDAAGVAPPYWAFAWPGGQAVARLVLDQPALVRGREVLDFAAGSGLAAIAARRAGAVRALASDTDPIAAAAIRRNAALNDTAVAVVADDVVDTDRPPGSVLLAGDVCYEQPMAGRVAAWLHRQAARGVLVLLGDPGRHHRPDSGLVREAHYDVPVDPEIEEVSRRFTDVWRVDGNGSF